MHLPLCDCIFIHTLRDRFTRFTTRESWKCMYCTRHSSKNSPLRGAKFHCRSSSSSISTFFRVSFFKSVANRRRLYYIEIGGWPWVAPRRPSLHEENAHSCCYFPTGFQFQLLPGFEIIEIYLMQIRSITSKVNSGFQVVGREEGPRSVGRSVVGAA